MRSCSRGELVTIACQCDTSAMAVVCASASCTCVLSFFKCLEKSTPTIESGGITDSTTAARLGERYTIMPAPMTVCAKLRQPSLRLSVSALPTIAVSACTPTSHHDIA